MQVGDRPLYDISVLGSDFGFDAVEVDRALIQPNVEDGEEVVIQAFSRSLHLHVLI
jgi:hypothetical protein